MPTVAVWASAPVVAIPLASDARMFGFVTAAGALIVAVCPPDCAVPSPRASSSTSLSALRSLVCHALPLSSTVPPPRPHLPPLAPPLDRPLPLCPVLALISTTPRLLASPPPSPSSTNATRFFSSRFFALSLAFFCARHPVPCGLGACSVT